MAVLASDRTLPMGIKLPDSTSRWWRWDRLVKVELRAIIIIIICRGSI
jgi:hypothetical protein